MAAEDQKVNPFKELPKPKQPQVSKEQNSEQNKEKQEQPRQRGEIVIKLNSLKIMKGFGVLLLLLAVFYAGRFTAGNTSFELPDFSKYFSSDAGPSGLVTGETEEKSEVAGAEVAVEAPPNESAEPESNASVEKVEEKLAADVDDKPEKFTTEEYSQVTLSLDSVYKDWKGTWGKITGIQYTITNNEVGTIKPHHFVMVVEGYEDGEKHFDVGIASQRVKSEQAVSDEAAVSGGFGYSAVSIPDGDLTKVLISLALYDVNGEIIASTHQEMNLQG